MILLTLVDEHHDQPHEVLLPEGVIPAGWYPTTSIDGHYHGVWIEEDVEVGDTVKANTDLSLGPAVKLRRHAHEIEITAVEVEVEGMGEETDVDDQAGVVEELADDRAAQAEPKSHPYQIEVKVARSSVIEVKQADRNGVPVGIVAGYLSTWQPDTGGRFGVPDQFVPGAWLETLAEHRARGARPVRLKDHHGRTVGGFPIESVREDERGLFGIGEINLEVQQGREAFALARQGVISDFSVGYVALDDKLEKDVRRIFRATLFESSLVDEPGNQGANIVEVKAIQEALAAQAGFIDIAIAKEMTVRDLEAKLQETGAFSRSAARYLAGRIVAVEPAPTEESKVVRYDPEVLSSILRELQEAKAAL